MADDVKLTRIKAFFKLDLASMEATKEVSLAKNSHYIF